MTGTVTKVFPRELVSFIPPPAKGPGTGDSNKQAAIGLLHVELPAACPASCPEMETA